MGRASSRIHIEIQTRDLAVLRGLFDARVMTVSHVAALHFEGRQEAAKKRLQKLKAEGLVGERPRRPYEPSILSLTKRGLGTLRDKGLLAGCPDFSGTQLQKRCRVSELTLRHELDVMDVKAALTRAVGTSPGLRVLEFSTWPPLHQFEACGTDGVSVLVKPDGFIRIGRADCESRESLFYLEVDRSTETQDVLAERSACYRDYYRSGALARQQRGDRARGENVPFRVLFVFKTSERRNNTAERLLRLHPPILRQAWLTTSRELLHDPLGAIWVRPHDYLEVTRGTAYDPLLRREFYSYRRQSGRDDLVERTVQRHPLFDAGDRA